MEGYPGGQASEKFGPGLIRDELDKRDGFSEKKRAAHYSRLCVLCGHPTFAGFAMLRPHLDADAHMGPFLVPALLDACIQELVQVSIIATQSFIRFFPPKSLPDFQARSQYIEKHDAWFKLAYGN